MLDLDKVEWLETPEKKPDEPEHLNCFQRTLMPNCDLLGITEEEAKRMGTYFGGGMRAQGTCGPVIAVLLLLGAIYGNDEEYKDVRLDHMYVDNCAQQFAIHPSSFDVVVTSNMFGDILSDEAAVLSGSIGMLPSASIGEETSLYEPIHGSAPDIAGKGIANPIATILSAAMLLRYSLNEDKAADAIEKAVNDTLEEGYRTGDIYREGMKRVDGKGMKEAILAHLG